MAMMLMGLTDAIVLGQYAPEELAYVLSAWLPIGVSLGFGIGILLGVQVLTRARSARGRVGLYLPAGALVGHRDGRRVDGRARAICRPSSISSRHDCARQLGSGGCRGDTNTWPRRQPRSPASRLRPIGHMISQACSIISEHCCPLLVTIVSAVGVVINIFANLALVAGWGVPADGRRRRCLGHHRYALDDRSHHGVDPCDAALTPGFRRSRLAAKGEARLQLEVGTGTAISNIAEWGRFQRHLHHRHLGLHRGQRCLWLFGAGDGRVLRRSISASPRLHPCAWQRLSGGAIRKRCEECRSPGMAATMVMGVIRRAAGKPGRANLAASGAGGCDHRGHRDCRPLRRCSAGGGGHRV